LTSFDESPARRSEPMTVFPQADPIQREAQAPKPRPDIRVDPLDQPKPPNSIPLEVGLLLLVLVVVAFGIWAALLPETGGNRDDRIVRGRALI
jgi:hypothetical protein